MDEITSRLFQAAESANRCRESATRCRTNIAGIVKMSKKTTAYTELAKEWYRVSMEFDDSAKQYDDLVKAFGEMIVAWWHRYHQERHRGATQCGAKFMA